MRQENQFLRLGWIRCARRSVFASQNNIGYRVFNFISLAKNVQIIVPDHVRKLFRVPGFYQTIGDVRLDHMLKAPMPKRSGEDLLKRRRTQVEREFAQQPVQGFAVGVEADSVTRRIDSCRRGEVESPEFRQAQGHLGMNVQSARE